MIRAKLTAEAVVAAQVEGFGRVENGGEGGGSGGEGDEAIGSGVEESKDSLPVLDIELHDALKERHFGSLEGVKWTPGATRDDERAEGIETKAELTERMERFVDEILYPAFLKSLAQATPIQREESEEKVIVIVSHGIALGSLHRVIVSKSSHTKIVGEVERGPNWSNTGILEIRLTLPSDSKLESFTKSNGAENSVKLVSAPYWRLIIEKIDDTTHLNGLVRTKGGLGSAKWDEKQSKLGGWFKPVSKRSNESNESAREEKRRG